MIAAMVARFSFQVAPRMGSPEVGAGRGAARYAAAAELGCCCHAHSHAAAFSARWLSCNYGDRHRAPLGICSLSECVLQDVRAAEVNRLTLQSGKGVWLLLEPRDGAQADAGAAAVVGAAAGAAH